MIYYLSKKKLKKYNTKN